MGDKEEVQCCEEYKYLGVNINRDGKDTEEIRDKKRQGRIAVKRLN